MCMLPCCLKVVFKKSLPIAALVGAFIMVTACRSKIRKQPIDHQRVHVTIAGPITTFTWPMYIAKEAGYYDKVGLDVKFVFANHPAGIAMLLSGQADVNLNTLQQAMQISPKESSLLMVGSPLTKWLFALMARKDIPDVPSLKGRRIGVSQLGDSTYNYAVRLLALYGVSASQVDWVVTGPTGRVAALASGRVDATMLSAPAYFTLEGAGYRSLANISDYPEIKTPNVLLFRKTRVAKGNLPELLIKAHAEAVKRFYDDREFAIAAHLRYDKQEVEGLKRTYDTYKKNSAFERIPYILTDDVEFMIRYTSDPNMEAEMKAFNYRTVIDNSIVKHLVDEGFFEQLFGSDIVSEEHSHNVLAFK